MISLLELFGHHKGRTKEREPKCSQPAESTLLLLQSSSRRNADTAISGTICCCKEYLRPAEDLLSWKRCLLSSSRLLHLRLDHHRAKRKTYSTEKPPCLQQPTFLSHAQMPLCSSVKGNFLVTLLYVAQQIWRAEWNMKQRKHDSRKWRRKRSTRLEMG